GIEALGHQGLHALQLRGAGGPRIHTHDAGPHGPVANLYRQVERCASLLHGIQISPEIAPGGRKRVGILRYVRLQHLARLALQWGTKARAAIPGELECYALPDLALRRGTE